MVRIDDEPYEGLERINPQFYVRLGRIEEVLNSREALATDPEASVDFGKVKITWLDWGGGTTYVPISYPSCSNPLIDDNKADISKQSQRKGVAYGIFHMPSVNDIAICGFRIGGSPIILGYLPHNLYQQTLESNKGSQWGYIRPIISGEFSKLSKPQAEVYLDRKGAIRLITKDQPINPSDIPEEDLCLVTIGNVWDSTFSQKEVSSYGKDLQFKIACKNNTSITTDDDGNVEVNIDSGKEVNIKSSDGANILIDSEGNIKIISVSGKEVNINNGDKGVARLDDKIKSTSTDDSTFWTWFASTLITFLNTHTHSGVTTGPGVSGPTVVPISSSPSSLTGKIIESSDSVKAGD